MKASAASRNQERKKRSRGICCGVVRRATYQFPHRNGRGRSSKDVLPVERCPGSRVTQNESMYTCTDQFFRLSFQRPAVSQHWKCKQRCGCPVLSRGQSSPRLDCIWNAFDTQGTIACHFRANDALRQLVTTVICSPSTSRPPVLGNPALSPSN